MTPERIEHKNRRPRIEEFSKLDPKRIGETLGWKNNNVTETGTETTWHFSGPVSLSVSRQVSRNGSVISSINLKIIDEERRIIATVNKVNISEVTFNSAQKRVIFRTKSEGSLIVRGSGQIAGMAHISVQPVIRD